MNNDQDPFYNFVNGVYHSFGESANYSVSRLYAWFLDGSNIGKLNNLIGTNFSGVCYKDSENICTGYALLPQPSNNELAIYKQLFEVEYYSSQAQNLARSAATKGSDWISLAEGDSSITRVNPHEVAKTFRGFYNDSYKILQNSVKMYLKYNAVPDQVVGDDSEGVVSYNMYEYNRVTY